MLSKYFYFAVQCNAWTFHYKSEKTNFASLSAANGFLPALVVFLTYLKYQLSE